MGNKIQSSDAKNDLKKKDESKLKENFKKTEDKTKDSGKQKRRCLVCKKKVGLTAISCRCGGLFCSIHRYSDKHDCDFDYKAMGKKEISEANPVVKAKKIDKI